MVAGSILEIIERINALREKIMNEDVLERLKVEDKFFYLNNMKTKDQKVVNLFNALLYMRREFEQIKNERCLHFKDYFKNFDYEFGYSDKMQFGLGNDELMRIVVHELNKNFPQDNWLFFNDNLIIRKGDLERLQKAVKNQREYERLEVLKQTEKMGEFETIDEVSKDIKNNVFYKTDTERLWEGFPDYPYIVGNQFGTRLVFKENATGTYGHDFSPVEKVVNDTIVREIDERCVERVGEVLERVNTLEQDYNQWQKEYDEFHASLQPKKKSEQKQTDGKQDL